jgi:Spy/CpxP family protein refolding chaperone
MKRSSRLVLAVAVLAAGLSASVAWSFPRGHGGGHRFERAVESLGLDADTQARVDAVFDAARPAKRELGRTMRAESKELRTLMADSAATEEAVTTKVEAIGKLATEMRKQEVRTAFQVRALLSADQRAQLAEKMEKRRHHRGGKCEGGRH